MASGNKMDSANATYAGFLTIMKFGTIATGVVVAGVVFLLAS